MADNAEKGRKRSPIIKERVLDTLQKKGITQKGMCEDLGIDYTNFNKTLNRGTISVKLIESIGEYLDRAPEWLSGQTDAVAPGSVFRYSFHLNQDIKMSDPLKLYLTAMGLSVRDYDNEAFWRLDTRIRTMIYEWADEQKGKKNGNDQRG